MVQVQIYFQDSVQTEEIYELKLKTFLSILNSRKYF